MKNFHTNFYGLIELHELNQFKIRVIRLIVESLQSICVEIFQYEISKTDGIILNATSLTCSLQPCIIIIPLLGPIITWAGIAEGNGTYALQIFDAIFYRDNQS